VIIDSFLSFPFTMKLLLLCLIFPCEALRLFPSVPEGVVGQGKARKFIARVTKDQYGEAIDVEEEHNDLAQGGSGKMLSPDKALAKRPKDRAQKLMRKLAGKNFMGSPNDKAWIVFVGDSNMRHSFYWWTHDQLSLMAKRNKSLTFHYGPSTWSDQEAIIEFPDGFEVRASFRFLHGSQHEFAFKTKNWHSASQDGFVNAMDIDKTELAEAEKNSKMDDPNAVQPSVYAKWAAQHQKIINFEKENPVLAARLKKYEGMEPSAVIMTEGWGGIPSCGRFDSVLDDFKSNPATKFVWSPIYVTNRQEERHNCFSGKIQENERDLEIAPDRSKRNFKVIDLWDMASHLPKMGNEGVTYKSTVHVNIGGSYMIYAIQRFEDALDELASKE